MLGCAREERTMSLSKKQAQVLCFCFMWTVTASLRKSQLGLFIGKVTIEDLGNFYTGILSFSLFCQLLK